MKHQNRRLSRKERRKATRVQKKQKMNATYISRFSQNRNGENYPSELTAEMSKTFSKGKVPQVKVLEKKHRIARYAPVSSNALVSKSSPVGNKVSPKKREQPKEERGSDVDSDIDEPVPKVQAKKQSTHNIDVVVAREQRQLRQLEKQLKLNKRKTLPKSFTDDGLDYLLDACDSEKLKSWKESEDEDSDDSSDKDSDESSDDNNKMIKVEDSKMVKVKSSVKRKRKVHFEDEMQEDDSEDSEEDGENVTEEDEENSGYVDEEPNIEEEMVDDGDEEEAIEDTVGKEDDEVHEDIYGRLINKKGSIVLAPKQATTGAYVPPAKRAAMLGQYSVETDQIKKQIKGLLNRATEANMASIANAIEELYMGHSRAMMNDALFTLIKYAVVARVMTPERLVAEMALLVAVLHANVGVEVGSYFLQHGSKLFDSLQKEENSGNGHSIDNVLLLLAYLYNFKVAHAVLIFDIMDRLIQAFGEKDIELILLLLKTCGFSLRRDDPEALGNHITSIHSKAHAMEENGQELPSRLRFMLEVLIAVRNNNVRRVPGADIERTDRMKKIAGICIRNSGIADNQMKVELKDLLNADEAGRWWIVGSAWEGRPGQDAAGIKESCKSSTPALVTGAVSQKLVRLGKKLGMNSDIRRSIFYALLSSEDYEDGFQKVLQIGLNEKQQHEIVVVAVTCCKKESSYNPFYSHFLEKLSKLDKKQGRKFMRMIMTHMWDEFKLVGELGSVARHNLAMMLAHLLSSQALSLEVLKKLEFGALEKAMMKFLRATMTQLLLSTPLQDLCTVFRSIGRKGGFLSMADGLRVFLKVHMKAKKLEGEQKKTLSERLDQVCDELLFSRNLNL